MPGSRSSTQQRSLGPEVIEVFRQVAAAHSRVRSIDTDFHARKDAFFVSLPEEGNDQRQFKCKAAIASMTR